jgi:hypothetical protein
MYNETHELEPSERSCELHFINRNSNFETSGEKPGVVSTCFKGSLVVRAALEHLGFLSECLEGVTGGQMRVMK